MATTTITISEASITVSGQTVTVAHITPASAAVTVTGQAVVADITMFISPASAVITVTGQGVYPMPIFADPIDVIAKPDNFIQARTVGNPTNRDNDVTWYAKDDNLRGVINVVTGLSGSVLSRTILASTIDVVTSLSASVIPGLVVSGTIDVVTELDANWYIISGKENWVAWSKIGEASFVMDRSNEAGYRPMDWSGWALRVLPLEEMAVVYGDNGICMMYPVDSPAASFGFKNIASIGIKSAYSVGGSEHVHYFITTKGELWRLNKQGPELLGFKEFLNPLVNPVLNYEESERRLFITDNSTGYIFKDGLGGGCVCITSISGGYYAGPHDFVIPPIEIMTDIIDLGHRGIKTTTFIEVGTETTEDMYVAVDFRYTKAESWRTSTWTLLNPEGVARIQVAGVEFRIRIKQLVYDEVRIDYINVRHQRPDKRFLRGPLYEQPDQGEA